MARTITRQRGGKTVTVKAHGVTWWLLVGWWWRLICLPVLAFQRLRGTR
jgi:hypothetical protein